MAVGVLALQGSFNEHLAALRRVGVKGVEVRKPEQLDGVDALIIPGGESTTMAKLAHYHNLFPALRDFVNGGKPVWGTCAGLIFLANKAIGQKAGGQDFIGGLDCTVHRNFFGSQLQSFETEISVPKLAEVEGGAVSCRGVFIRAPAVLEAGSSVEVLADYPVSLDKLKSVLADIEGQETGNLILYSEQNRKGSCGCHVEVSGLGRARLYLRESALDLVLDLGTYIIGSPQVLG